MLLPLSWPEHCQHDLSLLDEMNSDLGVDVDVIASLGCISNEIEVSDVKKLLPQNKLSKSKIATNIV